MSVGFRSNVRALQISSSISRINDKPWQAYRGWREGSRDCVGDRAEYT